MDQTNETLRIIAAKLSAKEALQQAMIGPTSGGTARQLAPVILDAIMAGNIPGVTASFLEKQS